MTVFVQGVPGSFAAMVSGIEISGNAAPQDVARTRQALLDHGVIIIRGQQFDDHQHVAFSRLFGEIELHTQKAWLLPDLPEILALNNRGERGTKPIMNGGAYWHTDVSYKARPPIGSLLHGIEVPPEGGDTLYADMCGAYDALDDAMKARLAGLRATHSYVQRYEAMAADDPERPQLTAAQLAEVPAVSHPVVRTNPESGRKALYVNEGFTVAIEGLPEPESRALLDQLFTHSTDERFRYRHRWQAGDLVIWDNRTTMHCATAYDRRHARNLHRTTIVGDVPV